jgi:hypothetical protein
MPAIVARVICCETCCYQWVDSSALAEASWLIERLTERDDATLF